MKKSMVAGVICLWFLCFFHPAYSQGPVVDTTLYFPLDQGRSWEYVDPETDETLFLAVNGTEEICGHKCTRLVGSDDSAMYFVRDENGLRLARMVRPDDEVTVTYCPPLQIIPPRIDSGAAACIKPFKGEVTEGFGISEGWHVLVVEGVTEMKVPAGTFDKCIQVTLIIRANNHPRNVGAVERRTIWFAPNVGIVAWVGSEAKGTIRATIKGWNLQSYSD